MVTVDSGVAGPAAWVSANVHGDEVVGLVAAHALVGRLERGLRRGVVHLVPTCNPGGLAAGVRGVPPGDEDLNRLFPGNRSGSLGDRLAHALWSALCARGPHLVVDLHSDSAHAIPYAIVDRAVRLDPAGRGLLEARAEALAASTGLQVVHEYPDGIYRRYGRDRTLTGAVTNLLRVPALTVECGPRGYAPAEPMALMVDAILGALTELDVASEPAATQPTARGGRWRLASGPRAAGAGLLGAEVAPGRAVRKGDVLARLSDAAGRTTGRLLSPEDAVLLSLPDRAWVAAGETVGTLMVPEP